MKNMNFKRKLPIPMDVKAQYPLTEELSRIKEARDAMIADVFTGKSDKMLLIIGPCSADYKDAVLDYIHRLRVVQEKVQDKIRLARQLLDSHGFQRTESILNEWNYIKGWVGDDWIYSLKAEKGLKGSAFIAANMCMAQYERLDNLMFYDARPCPMNSLFSTDFVFERLKG